MSPVLVLILNIIIPGVGTLVLGESRTGLIQLIAYVIAFLLYYSVSTLFGAVTLAVWIWALVVSIRAFRPA